MKSKRTAEAYTVREIARLTRYTPRHIARLCRNGAIPAYQIGGPRGEYRVYGEDLKKFLLRIIRRGRKMLN